MYEAGKLQLSYRKSNDLPRYRTLWIPAFPVRTWLKHKRDQSHLYKDKSHLIRWSHGLSPSRIGSAGLKWRTTPYKWYYRSRQGLLLVFLALCSEIRRVILHIFIAFKKSRKILLLEATVVKTIEDWRAPGRTPLGTLKSWAQPSRSPQYWDKVASRKLYLGERRS